MSRPLLVAATAGLLIAGTATRASAQGTPPAAQPEKTAATTTAAPGATDGDESVVVRYPPTAARWRVLVAGLGVFAVAYGGAALMGGLWEDIPGGDYLFIPVAGPWIGLANSGCAPGEATTPEEDDCEAMIGVRAAIYVVDGLMQLGGLGLIAQSIFMTTESETAAPATKASIVPAPIITPTTVGFGVMGTF